MDEQALSLDCCLLEAEQNNDAPSKSKNITNLSIAVISFTNIWIPFFYLNYFTSLLMYLIKN